MEAATKTQHVMFVISGLERGGAEYQLVAIAAGLSERGWRVTVLSFLPFSSTSWRSELQGTDIRLLTLNASSGLLKYVSLASAIRVVRRIRPDILIGFMYHGIMTARIVGQTTGVPINVSSIHSDRHGSFRELVMRVTDGLTDAVTALSRHLATELVDRRVAASSHVYVIPNSVDVARFAMRLYRDRTRERFRVGRDQFLWLAVGRLDHAKDYPNLLNAFAALAQPPSQHPADDRRRRPSEGRPALNGPAHGHGQSSSPSRAASGYARSLRRQRRACPIVRLGGNAERPA